MPEIRVTIADANWSRVLAAFEGERVTADAAGIRQWLVAQLKAHVTRHEDLVESREADIAREARRVGESW